jgi:hypothetical protein
MPPRRPASPALVVTLAAIGALVAGAAGTGAYLGVSEYLDNRPSNAGPDGSGDPTGTGGPQTTAAGDPCPAEIGAAVKDAQSGPGNLTQVIYVKGALAGRESAEAWICRDSDGTIYYQGHELAGPFVGGASAYTLLLGGSVKGTVTVEGSVYRAFPDGSPGFHYEVSPDTFAKVEADGDRRDYDVVEVLTDLR